MTPVTVVFVTNASKFEISAFSGGKGLPSKSFTETEDDFFVTTGWMRCSEK
jgi:hypothetical protein